MPIYEFICEKCGSTKEELRKMGDMEKPICNVCNEVMDRFFTDVGVIIKCPKETQEKLKKRSKEQGKQFFSKAAYNVLRK